MSFMSNKVKHHIKWEYFLYAGALLVFAYLKYLFPYSGDDWAWGSVEGLERLSTFFQGYNGRYVWTANQPEGSFWEDRYKLFHGIGLDKHIKFVSKKKLNKYAARFLQEQGR